jgi:phage FluMu protein Com
VKSSNETKRAGGAGATEKPFRCLCGSLLARLVHNGVELKCRKCKRHIIVPLTEEKIWTKIDVM